MICLSSFSHDVFAVSFNCIRRSLVDNVHNMYQPIAIVDENDRRDEVTYARENNLEADVVKKRFSPTGMITCASGVKATAQVSYKNNVLTTAGHIFVNQADCKETDKPRDCIFRTLIDGKAFVSKIRDSVGNGFAAKCPSLPKRSDDWAVLRLETPLPDGASPYQLADGNIREEESIIQVSAISKDFYEFNPNTGKRHYPKHIGNCSVKKVYLDNAVPIYFGSNCDIGSGSSGGAVIRMRENQPTLLGITVNKMETEEQEDRASRGRRAVPNQGVYSEGRWATYNVPVAGAFRAAIKRAGDSDDI